MVVPNLNVGWRAPGDGGAEQTVQLLDLVARACWEWEGGIGGGLEKGGEEGSLRDGELGVGGHDGRVVIRDGRPLEGGN